MTIESSITLLLAEKEAALSYSTDEGSVDFISFGDGIFTFHSRAGLSLEPQPVSDGVQQMALFKDDLLEAFKEIRLESQKGWGDLKIDLDKNLSSDKVNLVIRKDNRKVMDYTFDANQQEVSVGPRNQDHEILVSEYLAMLDVLRAFVDQMNNF